MHVAAYQWVAANAKPGRVLEVGSRNINGGVRDLFGKDYIGIDIEDGNGVDVIADVKTFTDRKFDVVVCCEVLEHVKDWQAIIDAAGRLLKAGGRFILTAAGPGRPEHSAVDGGSLRGGEHYANIHPADLEAALKGWTKADVDILGNDVRAVAVK